jgi:hypothetical protein
MHKSLILAWLDSRRTPRKADVGAASVAEGLADCAPALAVTLLADEDAHASHRADLLAILVQSVRMAGVTASSLVDRLHRLDAANGLVIVDGLRAARINSRLSREVGLRFLLGHPDLPAMAANHRGRLVALFRHFLGERTWSAVTRALRAESSDNNRFLQRTVLRYSAAPAIAREALGFLAAPAKVAHAQEAPTRKPWLLLPWVTGKAVPTVTPIAFHPANALLQRRLAARRSLAVGEGLSRETLSGLRGTYHRGVSMQQVRLLAAATRPSRTDGPLTAIYKTLLTEKPSPESIRERLTASETPASVIPARVAVVLDLSASAVSSGERLNHPAGLGQAVTRRLVAGVSDVTLRRVGGASSVGDVFAIPMGETDLAAAVLRAARERPDAIVVVTDGYENVREGDVTQVVAGLRRLGLTVPVFQVLPVFTPAEDIRSRCLGANIVPLPLHHERGVGELLARIFLATRADTLHSEELVLVGQLLLGR